MVSKKTTQDRFNEILSFKNDKEKMHFEAEIFSLDIMFEVECLMKKHGTNKTELSMQLGVSKGYLTQLFTGDKLINLKTMAKLQRIFNIKFAVSHESIKKLKLQTMGKKSRNLKFPDKFSSDWHKRIVPSGKTYEIREVPRQISNTEHSGNLD